MTFVAAKCFGESIVIASDTMISRPAGASHDILPGRLKIVIVSSKVTIAFAGLINQSIDAIREVRRLILTGGLLSEVEEILRRATERYASYGVGLEFIVASHVDGVALKRIWEGTISANLHGTCIGDRALQARLLEEEARVPIPIVPSRFEDERECQDFRVWAGMMGKKESYYASTQRAYHPQRASRSTAGGRRRQCGI